MSAARFVGRVGGLAIALGVGTIAFGGATAWADSSSSDSTSPSSSSQSSSASAGASASGRSARHTGPRAPKPQKVAAPAKSLDDAKSLDAPVLPASAVTDTALLGYSRRATAGSALTPSPAAAVELEAPELPQAAAAENIALIMGPSGDPIPSDEYLAAIFNLYVQPNSPEGTLPEGLVTPEGLYPITGVKSLPLNTSVDQGITILDDAIKKELDAGNTVTVFGWSQSAIISSLEMANLDADTPINFILVGNEMNPNGGFLSRFPDFDMPSLGIPFYGPTPPDSFPVVNYTLEYDGFADFPRYPLNVLSVLNAGLGIIFVHTKYAAVTPEQVENAIALPSSDETQQYYIIPHPDLPLLEPLRMIPVIGDPIADLLQPALKVIVNLGYGDPNYGWSTDGYANELTPFGVNPDVDWGEVITLFVEGIQQGVQDFIADITPGGSFWQDLETFVSPVTNVVSSLVSAASPDEFVATVQGVFDNVITAVQTAVTDVAEFISNAAASLYAALLPTADIVNAIVTVLPAYAFTQFTDGIEQVLSGDVIDGLINTFLMPVAAASGLLTTAVLIELLVVMQAVTGVVKPSE